MGIRLFGSSSDAKYPPTFYSPAPEIPPGNPDPAKYKIIDTLTIGNLLIVEIVYPDCKNYEGKKILVYEGITALLLRQQKYIDPHFSNNSKYKSPIARFEPTGRGMVMAVSFAKMWNAKK